MTGTGYGRTAKGRESTVYAEEDRQCHRDRLSLSPVYAEDDRHCHTDRSSLSLSFSLESLANRLMIRMEVRRSTRVAVALLRTFVSSYRKLALYLIPSDNTIVVCPLIPFAVWIFPLLRGLLRVFPGSLPLLGFSSLRSYLSVQFKVI